MGRGQITLQTFFFEELTATLQPKIPDRNFGSDGRVSARIYLYIHGQVYAYAHTIKTCLQRPRCISYCTFAACVRKMRVLKVPNGAGVLQGVGWKNWMCLDVFT